MNNISTVPAMPKKVTRWYTFGQSHKHTKGNIVFDQDCVVKISATDPRGVMFGSFGSVWSMEYDTKPDMSHYPRGIFTFRNGTFI